MSFFQNLDAGNFKPRTVDEIRQYMDENIGADIGIDVTGRRWGVTPPKGGGPRWISDIFPEYFGNNPDAPAIDTAHALRVGMREGRAENKKTRAERIEEYRRLVENEKPLPEGGEAVMGETVDVDANYILPHPQDRGCDWGLC